MAKSQKQETSVPKRVGDPAASAQPVSVQPVSAQPPVPQEAPRAAHGEKQPAVTQPAVEQPAVERHTPDHPSVTPALRTLIDKVHGAEYAILSAGKERAYIESKTHGFDIFVATGERA